MNMKRLILLTAISIFLISIITGIVHANKYDSNQDTGCIEVTVKEGDTLWGIAKQYYNGKSDFRKFVYEIREMNSLKEAIIYPGQVISIPIQPS